MKILLFSSGLLQYLTKKKIFHTFRTELSPFHQTSKNLNIQHELQNMYAVITCNSFRLTWGFPIKNKMYF